MIRRGDKCWRCRQDIVSGVSWDDVSAFLTLVYSSGISIIIR